MGMYDDALRFQPIQLERERTDTSLEEMLERLKHDSRMPDDPEEEDETNELDFEEEAFEDYDAGGRKKARRESISVLTNKTTPGRIFAYPPLPLDVEPMSRRIPISRPTYFKLLEDHGPEVTKKMLHERMDTFAAVILPHYMTGPFSKMHRYMYANYRMKMHTGAREALIAPRGSAKSTGNTLVLPVYSVCHEEYHHMILSSDTADQAEDYLADIKGELEANEAIDAIYPAAHGQGKSWRTDRIVTHNDVFIRAIGSGGRVRGRRYGIYRPDCIILDDVENKQMIESETMRKGLITWFDQDLVKVGARSQDVDIFVVGTIIHQEALLNQLLTAPKYASWNVKKFQSIECWSEATMLWNYWKKIYNDRHNLLREQEAYRFFMQNREAMLKNTRIMWNEWDSYYRLMEEVAKDGELAFFREKQNIPINPTDQTFRRDRINFYDEEEWENKVDPSQCIWVAYLDSALGKKSTKKGDNYALVVLAKHIPSGYVYLRYFHRKRASVSVQMQEAIEILQMFPYLKRFGVESNTFQVLIKDNLQQQLLEHGITCKLLEVNHGTDKTARIAGLEPFFTNGIIRLKDDGSQEELIQEMEWFPVGKDDGIDALESCFSLVNTRVFKMQFAQARQSAGSNMRATAPGATVSGHRSGLIDVGGRTQNIHQCQYYKSAMSRSRRLPTKASARSFS